MFYVILKILSTYFLIVCSLISSNHTAIEITANSMEWKKEANIAIATGNAKAVRGNSILSAKKIIVFFNKKNDTDAISRLDASGDVKFIRENQIATGDNAIYYVENDKINLKGDVSLQREDSIMLGDELTIDLKTSSSKLTSKNNERVRVKYNTKKKSNEKK